MINIDNLYKNYVAKCKEMKIKPGTKRSVFGDLIEKEEIAQRESIEELSRAKKAPTPKLSEEAIKASSVTTKLKVLRSRKPKPIKEPKAKKEAAPKIEKIKRIPLSPEERLERSRKSAREYQAKKRLEKGISPRQHSEETKRSRQEYQREYYKKNKELVDAKNKKFVQKNRDKVSEYNRKQREKQKDWTPGQWEEHRAKAREYRKQNINKIREQEKARGPLKRQRLKESPERLAQKQERDRIRYHEALKDPIKGKKLREKWRRDGERKRLKMNREQG